MNIKTILICALFFPMVWDVITTALGIVGILGTNIIAWGIAVVVAITIASVNLCTKGILKLARSGTNDLTLFLPVILVLCILFDFTTSLNGNARYLILSNVAAGKDMGIMEVLQKAETGEQFFYIILVTIITTASPAIVGWLTDIDWLD
ncbi:MULTISPECIES: hypothetical protein [Limnospira]|uniref:Uncharacterized protein n=1 Tax=Limnospira indica PCC 8005 TaxID=376219 RepID=A0A9P1KC17_9CYAN|nr:hypothetical protein [Limnospira indica]CDM93319.1 hypothetical protein (membrane) [Limnospira indica PCC 8005]